ncbi:hypothetical protein BJ912DRAFT_863619 [Pholiota molesta]|nr:hypothetical protein BJ912DRAFT_863619 [Pholiota molesta]
MIIRSGKDCVKRDKTVLSDTSTMRRHLEFLHSSVYRKWAKENHFLSMLPKDSSARRVAEQEALKQTSVNDHFTVQKPEDKPIAYSDEFFKEAALQWLIETDQPIHALENKAFRAMIQIAARATRSVHVPNRYQTRAAIINTFKKQMKALKDRLNVCVLMFISPSRISLLTLYILHRAELFLEE